MGLREIHITNLKRLRDFRIDFMREGEPRKWTVLIGPNGTGKSSILHAIAIAAVGRFLANDLINGFRESLPDKRGARQEHTPNGPVERSAEVEIRAEFERAYGRGRLRSTVRFQGEGPTRGGAEYLSPEGEPTGPFNEKPDEPYGDPLWFMREKNLPHLFVVGYGVQRDLPEAAPQVPPPPKPAVDRLRPLFAPRPLIGPNFSSVFTEDRSQDYAHALKRVLLRAEGTVPGVVDLELRGRGGVRSAEDLVLTHRFVQRVASNDLKLPARWLSHGYQSSLAWLADLVGQILLENPATKEPREVEGLVLIDEIDLYLHPTWQVGLVDALRETFPLLQFVVTTHSPILLNAFRRDEVIRLGFDAEGNVTQDPPSRDPRLLTGSELYEEFFGVDDLYPRPLARLLDAWRALAMNPDRKEGDEATLDDYERRLQAEGLSLRPRLPRRGGAGGGAG